MRQYDGSKTNLMASDARLYAYKNVTLPKGYHVDLILKIQILKTRPKTDLKANSLKIQNTCIKTDTETNRTESKV